MRYSQPMGSMDSWGRLKKWFALLVIIKITLWLWQTVITLNWGFIGVVYVFLRIKLSKNSKSLHTVYFTVIFLLSCFSNSWYFERKVFSVLKVTIHEFFFLIVFSSDCFSELWLLTESFAPILCRTYDADIVKFF